MILLVNMLILAHAVVPHHHHNKMFVAILNVLDEDARDCSTMSTVMSIITTATRKTA